MSYRHVLGASGGWIQGKADMEHSTRQVGAPENPGRVARSIALLVLALLVVLPRLPLQLAGPDAHLSLMVDDASYYMEAARRTAETGKWPSMDGLHTTNGFHPLYMAMLISIHGVAGTEPRTVLPIVMLLNLTFNAIAVWLLLRTVVLRRMGVASIAAGILLALDPGWLAHGTMGVENSLSSLLLLLAVLRWDRRYGRDDFAPGGGRGWLLDGTLLGLAILGRTDSAIFALAYLLGAVWRMARVRGLRPALAEAIGTGLVATIVVAPWLVSNLMRFGTVVQDSGSALAARYSSDYGPRTSVASLKIEATGLGFWAYRFLWAGGLVPLTGWLLGLSVPLQGLRRHGRAGWIGWSVAGMCAVDLLLRANDPTDIRDPRMAALELGLGVVAFLGGLLFERPLGAHQRPVFGMVFAAAMLTVLAYALGFRGFQVWYTSGTCLVFVLLVSWSALPAVLEGRRTLGTALLVLMALQSALTVGGLLTRGGREGMDRDLLQRGQVLRGGLERFAASSSTPVCFGSFDSGKLSYRVHPFPVTNTDGVMNHDASLAIRQDKLGRYLRAERITHLITDSRRIAEYRSMGGFSAWPDSASSAEIGIEVWRVGTQRPEK